jgi:hypothetical protein
VKPGSESECESRSRGLGCFTIYTARANHDRCLGRVVLVRTLLQNSRTILGDPRSVGATKVEGSVKDSPGTAGCCLSQPAQFVAESVIEMKRDKGSSRSGDRGQSLNPTRPPSKPSSSRRRQRPTHSSAPSLSCLTLAISMKTTGREIGTLIVVVLKAVCGSHGPTPYVLPPAIDS